MAMSFLSGTSAVTQRVSRMSSDANARRLVGRHNLNIVNVTWEDCARNKQSVWGPCISDMTLQVGDTRMPVIREPNFTDTTWDVPIDSIPLRIGNEKPEGTPMITIPLSEYLRNFSDYISKPPGGPHTRLNLLVEDGSTRDRHVVMSSQACFLPVGSGDQTKFNVAMYNYQSTADNPAVLTIVSTSKGTSAQIITGGDQKMLFNNNGMKADFAGQRLRDNRRERGVALEGEMSQQEKQENVIVIIQVPLVHREPSAFASDFFGGGGGGYGGFGNGGGFGGGGSVPSSAPMGMGSSFNSWESFGSGPQHQPQAQQLGAFAPPVSGFSFGSSSHSNKRRRQEKADVVAAIVRVAPRTDVTCSCNGILSKRRAWSCYEGGTGVNCDICARQMMGENWVYHCDKGKSGVHRGGYDLCLPCGDKQLAFDECNNRVIQRDRRYPIRVTLQYYKATANGVMDADIMNDIALTLASSRSQADAIGSLVTEVTDRTTEPELARPVVAGGYTQVREMLTRLGLLEYLANFQAQQVTDDSLLVLESHHITSLISKIGPRARFEAELKKWKAQQAAPSDWMSGFLS